MTELRENPQDTEMRIISAKFNLDAKDEAVKRIPKVYILYDLSEESIQIDGVSGTQENLVGGNKEMSEL